MEGWSGGFVLRVGYKGRLKRICYENWLAWLVRWVDKEGPLGGLVRTVRRSGGLVRRTGEEG